MKVIVSRTADLNGGAVLQRDDAGAFVLRPLSKITEDYVTGPIAIITNINRIKLYSFGRHFQHFTMPRGRYSWGKGTFYYDISGGYRVYADRRFTPSQFLRGLEFPVDPEQYTYQVSVNYEGYIPSYADVAL